MRHLSTPFLILPMLLLAAAKPDAAEFSLPATLFRELCFEANRLTGRALRPSEAMGWSAASKQLRESLRIPPDPRIEVYTRRRGEDGVTVFLKIFEGVLTKSGFGKGEMHHSCEIIYSGPQSSDAIYSDLKMLFGTEGYRDKIGLGQAGVEIVPGWRHWCWSDNLPRDNKRWHKLKGACIYVIAKHFYQRAELVRVLLRAKKEADPPFLTISFTWTYRPSRDFPKPKPVVGVTPLDSAEEREKQEEKE